jgi:hypothetical protein
MRIGTGNRSTRRKLAPVPLCPPQIPHVLTWAGNRTAEVGGRRLRYGTAMSQVVRRYRKHCLVCVAALPHFETVRKVERSWNKLHNEELNNLYSSPSRVRMIKSRWMRWAGHVARMGRRGMHIKYRWKSQKERSTRKTKT